MSNNSIIKPNAVYSYDGIAKSALDEMKDENLIIFINRIFNRDLSLKSKVLRLATETYDENIKQNRCDYYVCIANEMFLIELQSYEDSEMAVRVFDYGTRGSKLHARNIKEYEMIELTLPNPVVFYLRKGRNVVNELSVRLVSPENQTFTYSARAVYLDDYSFKDMIDNYMYPMMPFYPLRYEKTLLKKHTEEDEKQILDEIKDNLKILRKPLEDGIISFEDYRYIRRWMVETFRAVVTRSKKRKKFVNEKEAERVMQYMVDEPIEGFDIYKALRDSRAEGKLEGKLEGKDEGIKETQIIMIKNMLENNVTDDQISLYSGLSIEEINQIKKEINK